MFCVSGFTTEMVKLVAAAPAGTRQVRLVLETKVVEVQFTPLMRATAPLWKFVPANVTEMPPVISEESGVTLEIVGAATAWKPLVSVAACVSGFVTTSDFRPAVVRLAVVQRTEVALRKVVLAQATPPTVALKPLTKFVPVIVMTVPPATAPEVGLMLVIVGGALYVYWTVSVES